MNNLTEKERQAIKELIDELKKLYGDNLSCVILYGSKARGDADSGSDIDVLVVLKKMTSRYEEIKKIVEITSPICLKYNVLLSVLPKEENKVNSDYKTIFIHNVLKEGIRVL